MYDVLTAPRRIPGNGPAPGRLLHAVSTIESPELPSVPVHVVLDEIRAMLGSDCECPHDVATTRLDALGQDGLDLPDWVADLLCLLGAEGVTVTPELADAIVRADDDKAFELLAALRGPA